MRKINIIAAIVLTSLIGCDDTLDWVPEKPPKIFALSPESGHAGIEVEISGESFSKTLAKNIVMFNGVVAKVTNASRTSLTVIVPDSTSGPVSVTVDGNTASQKPTFHYE